MLSQFLDQLLVRIGQKRNSSVVPEEALRGANIFHGGKYYPASKH